MSESKETYELLDTIAKILIRCFVLGYLLLLLWFGVFQGRREQWRAIRHGNFKLIRKANDQLYDLSQDLGESNDVATKFPNLVGSLAARFDAWLHSIESDPTRSIGKKAAAH